MWISWLPHSTTDWTRDRQAFAQCPWRLHGIPDQCPLSTTASSLCVAQGKCGRPRMVCRSCISLNRLVVGSSDLLPQGLILHPALQSLALMAGLLKLKFWGLFLICNAYSPYGKKVGLLKDEPLYMESVFPWCEACMCQYVVGCFSDFLRSGVALSTIMVQISALVVLFQRPIASHTFSKIFCSECRPNCSTCQTPFVPVRP